MRAIAQPRHVPCSKLAVDHRRAKGAADRRAERARIVADAVLQFVGCETRNGGAADDRDHARYGGTIRWGSDGNLDFAGLRCRWNNHSADGWLCDAMLDRPLAMLERVDFEDDLLHLVGWCVFSGQFLRATYHPNGPPQVFFLGQRGAIFGKPMRAPLWTGVARLCAGIGTHLELTNTGHRREGCHRFATMGSTHKLVPDRPCTRHTGDVDHR